MILIEGIDGGDGMSRPLFALKFKGDLIDGKKNRPLWQVRVGSRQCR